jgi:glycosyltransferase involved in cell wall biosynthesis
MPLVSVIMATYNQGRFIIRSIESVLNQSFRDFELIIVNDGSTDDTDPILREWLEDHHANRSNADMEGEPSIVYLKNETNLGVPRSFNRAMKIARGKYIARIDSDDAWIGREKLGKQVEFLETHPDYIATGGGMIVVDPEGRELFRYLKPETDEASRNNALVTNPIANSTSLCRADGVIAVGCCREDLDYNEDWDFWLHMGIEGKFYNFQEPFSYYTMTGGNKSMVHLRMHTWSAIRTITKYRKHYPRYSKGLLVNALQLLYGFIPFIVRRRLNPFFSRMKKKIAGSAEGGMG